MRLSSWALSVVLAAALWAPAGASATTFTVDDPGDVADEIPLDGTCDAPGAAGCTLRAAVESATGVGSPGDDIIKLPFDVEISLGDLNGSGNGDLIVRGTATQPSVIDANDTSRILDFSGVSLTLENLELREGLVSGDSDVSGGAVQFQATGAGQVLRLEDSSVEDSASVPGSPAQAFGGGIFVTGTGSNPATLQLVDSDVTGNSAGDADTAGFGGGVAVTGSGPVVSVSAGSSVSSNTAAGLTAGVTGARGGGIAVRNDSGGPSDGSLTVNGSTLDANRAGGLGSAIADHGGGIYLQGPGGVSPDLNMTAATLSNNVAGGGSGNAEGRGGGAMVADAGGTVTLNGASFNGNRAGGNDNAADGTGAGFGGGLYSASDASSTDGVFLSNRAGVAQSGDVNGEGGGLALELATSPDLDITDNLFQTNLAGTGDASAAYGGAVSALGGGGLEVSGSNFLLNQSRTYGGALYRGSTSVAPQADTITNSSFTLNTARRYGGAIAAFSDTSMTISSAEIALNTASQAHGGGILFSGATPAASPPQLTIRNATISQNQALTPLGQGGGIALTFAGTPVSLQLTGSTLSDNSAGQSGGTMSIVGEGDPGDEPTIRVRGSIVEGGTAPSAPNCELELGDIDYASEGGNIESGSDCGFTIAGLGDLQSTDPLLDPLADNGESGQSGQTHALQAASPAIDNVPPALCSGLNADQRAVGRPQGPDCDSGAFEHEYRTVLVSVAGSGSGTVSGPGIGCPGICTAEYLDGSAIELTASPSGGGSFSGWSGACTGSGTCDLTLDADKAVTASFTAPSVNPPPEEPSKPQKKKCKKGQKKKKVKGKVKCVKKKKKRKKK